MTAARISAKAVVSGVGCKYLNLYHGKDYWYFVYDKANKYNTHSIYVCYLRDMKLEEWIAEGKAFVAKMEQS
jgi:hypothetical protein